MAHILIDRLSVEFAIYGSNARSLKNTIMAQATGGRVMAGARDVVAVRAIDNLSIEIRDGDRVAIVGHNGSGKTTLLRVLAGIYKPISGQATITGKVGTLLDPYAGMDHEATGLENIYLRGRLMGMTTRQIVDQIDDVAEFTGLGDFLGLPMKTYSAGMAARLAFAISTSVQNDILLIDEGIGTGDPAFQEQAQKRVEHFIARTSIMLLASHSEELLKRFCNRRVEMERGRLKSDAPMEQEPASCETTVPVDGAVPLNRGNEAVVE